ncbi:MAG: universal stress protein [Bryobacteraceae bacterium]|jgi:nucleotide-binding universal stress UspA family protein
MQTFGHILFPVDFSDRCQEARPFITSWARRFHAKVTLLHTIYIPISAYGGPDSDPPIIDVPGMEAAARKRLDLFEIDAAERIVTVGDPAYEIIQYAGKNGVDLIMMPTHGYGPFRSLLLGSTVAKVLHDAHCPVWTAAHTENPSAHSEIRNVLCALGGSENVSLIRSAAELAGAFAAKLRLVRAVPIDDTRPEKYLEGEYSAALIEMSREEVAAFQRDAGTNLEARVAGGSISQVVRETALADNADLVVIGSGKAHKTLGRLRSNAYAIIRESPCPVLSV